MRLAMACLYIIAGVVHLVSLDAFMPIVPGWVPVPRDVVLITGICEIAGGAALLTRRFRRLAGVMLAAYAVCVFPANIKHAVEGVQILELPSSWWYHGPRLVLQPLLVWWALFCTDVVCWPFRAKGVVTNCRVGRPVSK
jgi:uncharacterized membrane protein